MYYTDRVDGFQICDVSYFPGYEPKVPTYRYDIVKWEQTKPTEVTDLRTGEKKISTEHCYSVGFLNWNAKEPCFWFESVGLRWFEANPSETVLKMVMDFANKKEAELLEINDRIMEEQSWENFADYSVCPFCRKPSWGQTATCPSCGRRVYRR